MIIIILLLVRKNMTRKQLYRQYSECLITHLIVTINQVQVQVLLFIYILWKQRQRKIKVFAKGHRISKWVEADWNLDSVAPKFLVQFFFFLIFHWAFKNACMSIIEISGLHYTYCFLIYSFSLNVMRHTFLMSIANSEVVLV